MKSQVEILIDYSGSMGFLKGSADENKYLLPDGSTRMSLAKMILLEQILPTIDFIDFVKIHIFSFSFLRNADGTLKLKNNTSQQFFDLQTIFESEFNLEKLSVEISKIPDPESAGTPLYGALKYVLHNNSSNISNFKLILITDGDSNDFVEFDEKIIEFIKDNKIKCTIHIIGIAQSMDAELKSRNLCKATGGIYTNLRAINYNTHFFDNFLFDLKSGIITNEINELQTFPIPNNIPKEKNEIVSSDKIAELENKVNLNESALSLISKQLENITGQLKNLNKQNKIEEEEIEIFENEEANKRIGFKAEQYINKILSKSNLTELIWFNENGESYNNFDFQHMIDGQPFYIECKGTNSRDREFLITKDEWSFFINNPNNYGLYLVYDVEIEPKYFYTNNLWNSFQAKEIVPFSIKNRKLKANRIIVTLMQ